MLGNCQALAQQLLTYCFSFSSLSTLSAIILSSSFSTTIPRMIEIIFFIVHLQFYHHPKPSRKMTNSTPMAPPFSIVVSAKVSIFNSFSTLFAKPTKTANRKAPPTREGWRLFLYYVIQSGISLERSMSGPNSMPDVLKF